MTTTIPPKALFEISVEAQELIRALQKLTVGDVLKTEDICAITHRAWPQSRGLLETAFKHLRNDSLEFAVVRKLGVRRLANEEIPDLGKHYGLKAHRTALKGMKRMNSCDFDKLTNDGQVKLQSARYQLSCVAVITNVQNGRDVSRLIEDSHRNLRQIDISAAVKAVLENMAKGKS